MSKSHGKKGKGKGGADVAWTTSAAVGQSEYDLTDDTLEFFNSIFDYSSGGDTSSSGDDFGSVPSTPSEYPNDDAAFNACSLKYGTVFLPVYYKNQRSNLMCFPYCSRHGDYSVARLQGLAHDPMGATYSTCSKPVELTLKLNQKPNSPALWKTLRVMSRFRGAAPGEDELQVGMTITDDSMMMIASSSFAGSVEEPSKSGKSISMRSMAKVWKIPDLKLSKARHGSKSKRQLASSFVFETVVVRCAAPGTWTVVAKAASVPFQILSTKTLERKVAKARASAKVEADKEDKKSTRKLDSDDDDDDDDDETSSKKNRPEHTKKLRVVAAGLDCTEALNAVFLDNALRRITELSARLATDDQGIKDTWAKMSESEKENLYQNEYGNFQERMIKETAKLHSVQEEVQVLLDAIAKSDQANNSSNSDTSLPSQNNTLRMEQELLKSGLSPETSKITSENEQRFASSSEHQTSSPVQQAHQIPVDDGDRSDGALVAVPIAEEQREEKNRSKLRNLMRDQGFRRKGDFFFLLFIISQGCANLGYGLPAVVGEFARKEAVNFGFLAIVFATVGMFLVPLGYYYFAKPGRNQGMKALMLFFVSLSSILLVVRLVDPLTISKMHERVSCRNADFSSVPFFFLMATPIVTHVFSMSQKDDTDFEDDKTNTQACVLLHFLAFPLCVGIALVSKFKFQDSFKMLWLPVVTTVVLALAFGLKFKGQTNTLGKVFLAILLTGTSVWPLIVGYARFVPPFCLKHQTCFMWFVLLVTDSVYILLQDEWRSLVLRVRKLGCRNYFVVDGQEKETEPQMAMLHTPEYDV